MGNVHCLDTLRDGTPDTVRAEVEAIVDGVSRKGVAGGESVVCRLPVTSFTLSWQAPSHNIKESETHNRRRGAAASGAVETARGARTVRGGKQCPC